MGFPHLFGMQEDELDASTFQRHLQTTDQSMRSMQNQQTAAASLQNPFHQFTQSQFQQSMLPQQQSQQSGQHQGQQGQSNPMMQMMGSQPTTAQQQFGSNTFAQASDMSTNALLNRFAAASGGLSSTFSDPQQAAALFSGGNTSFLDNFSQQQGTAAGLQSNLRQLEMANDLLAAQRRISLGLGTTGHTMSGNTGAGMFDDFAAKNGFGSTTTGLEQLQGTDAASNLEGLMASQLQQQQQQQMTLQQQLMMMAAQQQQQGDVVRRNSFGSGALGGGGGGMDANTLSMQLMMGQQPTMASAAASGGIDLESASQNRFAKLQQQASQQQQQQQQQLHNFHDQQQHEDAPDELGSIDAGAFSGKGRGATGGDDGKKPRKKKAKTFPEKLMQAIMSHGEEDAVAWLPDGKSFVIVNDDLFVERVLAKAFKESKYTSFVRKLHRWGFVRLTSGTGTDCFHHPLFQRGRRDLANKITCTPRDKDGNLKTPHRNMKPPSLAGVERFIRQKADAAVAMAEGKAHHLDSDPGDSVPLQSTSGMPGVQSSTSSHLALEGSEEKSPEPLGLGVAGMTGNLALGGDAGKEMVKSIGTGNEDGHTADAFHSSFTTGEQADV